MRVAIDISVFPVGGAERQVAQLARGLAERGHRVLLIINKHGQAFRDVLDHPSIETVELGRTSRYDVRVLKGIVSHLRAFSAEVVLCENYNATLWGRLAAISLRVPVVTAEHLSIQPRRTPGMRLTNWALGPYTHAIVACAEGQVPYLVGDRNPEARIVVIRNGVDVASLRPDPQSGKKLRHLWGIRDESTLVGLIASHRAEKRHDRFIRLIETLAIAGVDVTGVMVGGGALLEQNRAAAGASAAAPRLVVAGPSTDMASVYNACDVVVLTSDGEVSPLSFLEAQACGTPVVGFDLSGVRETMCEGVTGYLVPEGDESAMAERVLELSRDTTLRRAMGAAGRAWVSGSLTLDAMLSAYESLLAEAVGSPAAIPQPGSPRAPGHGE